MKLKNSYIILQNVRLYGRHGVMEQEQKTGAMFTISLRVAYSVEKAMKSDEVTDTLSYADVYEILREEFLIPSRLLEHVAYRIAQRLAEEHVEVGEVQVKIIKDNPPMGADCDGAGIELTFS